MDRRSFLSGLAVLSGGCLGDSTSSESSNESWTPFAANRNRTVSGSDLPRPDVPVPDEVGTEVLTDGVSRPVEMTFLPNSGAYIVERTGVLKLLDSDGGSTEPALDLKEQLVDFTPSEQYELGLLGIELHPDFPTNNRLYIRYSAPPRAGTPAGDYHHTFVLSEFKASDDRSRIRSESERTVMQIPQPEPFHQSGDILFGPEGYLYVATGDSGQPGDGSVDHPGYVGDWYDENWGGNGQNTSDTLLAGMLRIDVDETPTHHFRTDDDAPSSPTSSGGYAIPESNPLVDVEGHREEYFAWGLRNPWKSTFHEGELFTADVGENRREEMNHLEKGGNYGWDVKEGSKCYYVNEPPENPSNCPQSTPASVRGGEPLIDPIVEYPWWGDAPKDRIAGEAIIGGHFYMGSEIPGLYGRYLFGDITSNERFFVATPPKGSLDTDWETELMQTDPLQPYRSFARDGNGEMYVLTKEDIRKIVPAS